MQAPPAAGFDTRSGKRCENLPRRESEADRLYFPFSDFSPLSAPIPATAALYADFMRTRMFGSLDGLRCLSILAVIWHHTKGDALHWLPGSNRGFLGVDLFFVISGFLIVTLLLRERTATSSISLLNFYGRRTLRIFPAYYGLLAALSGFFLVAQHSNSAQAFFAELPYHATYTSNFIVATSFMGISWSLATEEQFYLLWPPIEKFLGRWVLPTLGLVLVANQLVNFRIADPWLMQAFGVVHDDLDILQATFTPICLGVGLAHLLHRERGFALASRFLGLRAASMSCLLLLVLLGNLPSEDISGWQRLAIQLTMAALVCSCVVREDHGLRQFLTWAPIKRIGAISYGMYLYHVVAIYFAQKFWTDFGGQLSWVKFALAAIITIAIAELSFRFFEKPVLTLKRYFR